MRSSRGCISVRVKRGRRPSIRATPCRSSPAAMWPSAPPQRVAGGRVQKNGYSCVVSILCVYPPTRFACRLVQDGDFISAMFALGAFQLKEKDMVKLALFVRLEAKPGKEADVEKLLRGSLTVVQEEHDTTAWFAIRLGPSTFGIFDAFSDEAARQRIGRRAGRHIAQIRSLTERSSCRSASAAAPDGMARATVHRQ